MNQHESHTTAMATSKQFPEPDSLLWFESLVTGLEALLQEELARTEQNGRAATDLQRVQLLAAYLYEASRLGLDCLRAGLDAVQLNAGLGLRSTPSKSALDHIGAAKGGVAMTWRDPLWRLKAEAGMKGANALLDEELPLKDPMGRPATVSARAWALIGLGNRIFAAAIDGLIHEVTASISDLEQPSLFDIS